MSDILDRLTAALADELPAAVELRHELHRNPEVSGAEVRTAARVAEALGEPEAPVVAGTGRLVRVGGEGRCVALRAELDALAMREETAAPFASTNDAMHACGHDVHLAGLVAAVRTLRRVGGPLPVLAILQPREEKHPSGGQDVAGSGRLADEQVGAVLGVHLQPQVPLGAVAADPGVVNAACDEIEITVRGAGGHGAYPHLAEDPVPVLCRIVGAIPDVVRDTVDPMHPSVVTLGILRAGTAPNVLAETAFTHGTIRTYRSRDRELLFDGLRRLATGYAAAHGLTAEVTYSPVEPPMANEPGLTAAVRARLEESGFVLAPEFRSCGSDDFAFYSAVAPSTMIFLGTGDGERPPMLHDARFLPSDDRVADAARAYLAGYVGACSTLT
ncbi:M20 metallopeptidase family protein [Pseudonocardia endophytica]|uniref:Amidohydrolase n=1 Tax=Pseudonocardia endophytica TaxID=401976 RepID=A0A4R1HI09_PSEEN|nr:M20 family metallopeptidase [Pseudonocardia endophytica]TCK19940.1 amidohydrolase [Pseudonocardia endophytica]